MKRGILAIATILGMLSSLVIPVAVQAAPKTFRQMNSGTLSYNSTDNPRLNADPATTATFNGSGISHGSEGSPAQTTSDTNTNQIYTWRLEDLRDNICGNAVLTSLRVQASVNVNNVGNPDLAALSVYRIDGSNLYNLDDYTVSDGVDYATATGAFTPPNNGGISGVVRGSDPVFGGTLAGGLEAEWDLSDYDINDSFGIMIQQDSQDGSTDLQTAINTVDIEYDDAACVKDSAITKTLVNQADVKPGGTAIYEIKISNNGTDPIYVGGNESTLIYDIASPELTFVSANNGYGCEDGGTLQDVFGNEPDDARMYHNHLHYKFIMCGTEDGVVLQPGESTQFRMNFKVSSSAKSIINTAGYGIGGSEDGPQDPGALALLSSFSTIQQDGPDLLDLIISRQLVTDNFAFSSFNFTSTNSTSLANTGSSTPLYIMVSAILTLFGGGLLVIKRRNSSGLVFGLRK